MDAESRSFSAFYADYYRSVPKPAYVFAGGWQVAEVMGCAEGTVKALLHQGRRRIAEQPRRPRGRR